jgi:xylulokinase
VNGTITAIRGALAASRVEGDDVEAVGLAGQMHGLVALDRHDDVLRPAILWNDQRTEAECDEIRERIGRHRLIAVTGNDALAGFTAPKLMGPAPRARCLVTGTHPVAEGPGPAQLTGTRRDRADGAGTLLFDPAARDWSAEVVDALGIDSAWLPRRTRADVTGSISAEAANATGLRVGTPVVAGGGDQAAAAVGVGAVEPGVVSLSLGTSGVVFAATNEPLIDPEGRLHSFCHAVPDRWHVMGVMLSAAGSLQWFRDALAPGVAFPTLVDEAPARRRAATACCSSRTCRGSGPRIRTRTPAGRSSGSRPATAGRT